VNGHVRAVEHHACGCRGERVTVLAELDGHPFDLDALARHFPTGNLRILVDGDSTFLVADDLEDMFTEAGRMSRSRTSTSPGSTARPPSPPPATAWSGWTTKADLNAFTGSADNHLVSGIHEGRHARGSGEPPKRTVTLDEAQASIRDLARKWLDSP
jgi:hypothetical protein